MNSFIKNNPPQNAQNMVEIQLPPIFRDFPGIVYVANAESQIINTNKNFGLLAYASPGEINYPVVLEHFFPEDIATELNSEIQHVIETGEVLSSEETFRHKDGTLHQYLTLRFPLFSDACSATHQKNANADPLAVCSVLTDITEHSSSEDRLQLAEEHYRAIVSAMSEGVVLHDSSGQIVSCNKAAEDILGLTFEQMAGRDSFDPRWQATHENGSMFKGDDHPALQTLQDGQPRRNVIMGVKQPNASQKWISINSQPVFYDASHQQQYGVIVSFRDITQTRQQQAEIKKTSIILETILNQTPTMVIYLDDQYNIILVNQKVAEFYGKPQQTFKGRDFFEFCPEFRNDTNFITRLENIQISQETHYTPQIKEVLENKLYWEWQIIPVKNNEKLQGILITITDVTRRIEDERHMLRLASVVEQVPASVVIADAEGNVVYTNPHFNEANSHTGLIGSEQMTNLWKLRTNTGDLYEMWETLGKGKAWDGVFLNENSEEKLFYEKAKLFPVYDQNNKLVNFTSIFLDITKEFKSKQQLEQAAAVFESSMDAIAISDSDEKIMVVNQAFLEITGYTREDVIGKNIGKYVKLFDSNRYTRDFYNTLSVALDSNGKWNGELWNQRKNRELFPIWTTISKIVDSDEKSSKYINVFSDISEFRRTQEELEFLANHDPLTGLPNRRAFNSRLEQALDYSKSNEQTLALLFIDLDRFRNINDSLGHHIGDKLLKAVGRRLAQQVGQDNIARISGDEFVVILEDMLAMEEAVNTAEVILSKLKHKPFQIANQKLYVSASVGICFYPEHGLNAETLLKNADAALHQAKTQGRDKYNIASPELAQVAMQRLSIENQLYDAIAQRQFVVYYQPQSDTITGKIIGAEALIRWQHPERGMIPPDEFIPLAEETGLISLLGELVMNRACFDFNQWLEKGYALKKIAINCAGKQFEDPQKLQSLIEKILAANRFAPENLELEITEGTIMREIEASSDVLNTLRELGVQIAVDDFGTGYSSLNYLKKLPIHKLKIDKSFVKNLPDDRDDAAISRAIIDLCKNMQLKVLAEGVETQAQFDFLKAAGCDEIQGYIVGKPLPKEKFEALYLERNYSRQSSN